MQAPHGHQRHWRSAAPQVPMSCVGATQAVEVHLLHQRPGLTSHGQHQAPLPSPRCGHSQPTPQASKLPPTMATRPTPTFSNGVGTTPEPTQLLRNSQPSVTIPTRLHRLARNQAHRAAPQSSTGTRRTPRLRRTSRSTPMAMELHRLHRQVRQEQRLQ